jgi:hypothetical protein
MAIKNKKLRREELKGKGNYNGKCKYETGST